MKGNVGEEKNRNLDEGKGKKIRMAKWSGNIGRSGRIKQEGKQLKLSTEEGTTDNKVSFDVEDKEEKKRREEIKKKVKE